MNKQQLRVLIAEDIQGESIFIEEEMKRSDISHVIKCVSTQYSFKMALNDFSPDIIISGDTNPRLSGIWVMAESRKWNASIPVIVVSDLYDQAQIVKYFEAGAADFISFDQLVFLPLVVRRLMENNKNSIHITNESFLVSSPSHRL